MAELIWHPDPSLDTRALISQVFHGEWWLVPEHGRVTDLRYLTLRPSGPILAQHVARFGSAEEAMMAVELYENGVLKFSSKEEMLSRFKFETCAADDTSMYIRKHGRYHWLLKMNNLEVCLYYAAWKEFLVGSINLPEMRSHALGNPRTDLAVLLQIMSEREKRGQPSVPLNVEDLEQWREGRKIKEVRN